jgi:uncharacterized membrane protein
MDPSPSLHHWLRAHFVYPVAAVSTLLALFADWRHTAEPWAGPRLLWNLALAWVPYLCSLGLVLLGQWPSRCRGLWWGLFAAWLAFFPHAPYLITAWLYMPNFSAELWYSIGLFMTFSLSGVSGLLLSVISLYLVHTLLRTRLGPVEGGAVLSLVFLLSGLGVFMGRFLGLTSWDLVTRPGTVLENLVEHLRDQTYHSNPLYFSLGFATLLGVCYFVFLALRHAPRSQEEVRAWGQRW